MSRPEPDLKGQNDKGPDDVLVEASGKRWVACAAGGVGPSVCLKFRLGVVSGADAQVDPTSNKSKAYAKLQPHAPWPRSATITCSEGSISPS